MTDLRNPALLKSVTIGDRGTDSPVLWDPHALLFDRSHNLLAVPVSVAQVTNVDVTNPWQWGDTVFQGVYVFDVSVTNGLVLRGTITQIPGADIWGNWQREINRVLLIGNSLFTLSDAAVQVNDLGSPEKTTGLVKLPQPPQYNYGPIVFQPMLPTGVGTTANP